VEFGFISVYRLLLFTILEQFNKLVSITNSSFLCVYTYINPISITKRKQTDEILCYIN